MVSSEEAGESTTFSPEDAAESATFSPEETSESATLSPEDAEQMAIVMFQSYDQDEDKFISLKELKSIQTNDDEAGSYATFLVWRIFDILKTL